MKRPRIDKFKHYDIVIYAARGSNAARSLATSLGCRRWRDDLPERYIRRRPYFRGNKAPMVINWGSTVPATWLRDPRFQLRPRWYNSAEACSRAINKLTFFKHLGARDELHLLKYTTSQDEVAKWLKKGHGVVARKSLTGSSGEGIVILRPGDAIQPAPLYTRYYPKTHEFRAHVWKDKLIDFTQKKLRGGPNDAANRSIRSLDNGWVHAHGDLDVQPIQVAEMGSTAIACIAGLGLDFGAVDILASLTPERELTGYRICEVNTGPGLENSQTIKAYGTEILKEKFPNA